MDASPGAGERIPVSSLLFAPPHMKFSDYGVPKALWGEAFGAVSVGVSGASFFLSLHCPPQIQLWQLGGVPSTRVGCFYIRAQN